MPRRIHIFGASGSGATTLGRVLSERLGAPAFDSDDYFWIPTDPPYVHKRPPDERERLLRGDLAPAGNWILSGSMLMWGLAVAPPYTHLVYLWVPPEIRLARLAARERARFGAKILPGGPMFEEHQGFLAWAAAYDSAGPEQRSRALHGEWLATQATPTLRIEGDTTVEERVARVLEFAG